MAKTKEEYIATVNLKWRITNGEDRVVIIITEGEKYSIGDYFEKGKFLPKEYANRMIETGALVTR